MKDTILMLVGIIFLLIAVFFSFVSAMDYKKVLVSSLAYNVLALIALATVFKLNNGFMRRVSLILIVIGFMVGLQVVYRLFLI